MNKRKFFGTLLGILFWSVCVVFFTFAYYEWKSENTSIVLGINDLSTKCIPGTDVNVSNIGPVLYYEDGVKQEFSIENGMSKEMAIDLRLDITSISDNLLVESFKYEVVTDTTGGANYDYDNPVIEGDFENFMVGSNLITTALVITPSITQQFQFIVYIDGNMKNDPNMQNNSLVANLMIGNCEENATSLDELQYQAIYSETDNSLTFIYNKPVSVGETHNEKSVTAVYTDFEDTKYTLASKVPWYEDGNYANITSVTFEESVSPTSTAYWFYKFTNLTSIENIEKLDTSNVTSMAHMFRDCSSLTSLDLSNFDTSNVTSMEYMFYGSNFETLNISKFNTSNVISMHRMFEGCKSTIELDLTHFDTSNVTDIGYMFNSSYFTSINLNGWNTSKITAVDTIFRKCNASNIYLNEWDTSKVTSMYGMFDACVKLQSLDLSSFDTSNVTTFRSMFSRCYQLKALNISGFKTTNVTVMDEMFYSCGDLTELDLSSFDFSNVTSMYGMFAHCSNLTSLELGNFNPSKITSMYYVFQNCSKLKSLDLSNFDTSNITNMQQTFQNLTSLETLYLNSADFSNVTSYNYMFSNVPSSTNIYVKDEIQANWITEKYTNLTNIIY